MTSRASSAASKAKKIQKPLVERYFTNDQVERVTRPIQIEFEERDRSKFSEAKFKGRFLFVGDTNCRKLGPHPDHHFCWANVTRGPSWRNHSLFLSVQSCHDALCRPIPRLVLWSVQEVWFGQESSLWYRGEHNHGLLPIKNWSSLSFEEIWRWILHKAFWGVPWYLCTPWRLHQKLVDPRFSKYPGQRLISARREEFIPMVAKLITLLSRVTRQTDDSKYKVFTRFIVAISQGRAIRWGRVISDALWYQLAYFGSFRLFYMNFYLVYLLLNDKMRSKQLADKRYLGKKEFLIWRSYPKWWYHNKARHYYERNDPWEYEIYKDIKGEFVVKRISGVAVQAIRVHANFYL